MAGRIISGFIFGYVSLILIALGVFQMRSERAVNFYTGEKPVPPERVKDVRQWNRRHGAMWVIYGCCIAASWCMGLLIGSDGLWSVVPVFCGTIVPLPIMVWYHHHLVKKWIRQ